MSSACMRRGTNQQEEQYICVNASPCFLVITVNILYLNERILKMIMLNHTFASFKDYQSLKFFFWFLLLLFNWQTLVIFQPVLLKHYNALTSKICHGHSFVQKQKLCKVRSLLELLSTICRGPTTLLYCMDKFTCALKVTIIPLNHQKFIQKTNSYFFYCDRS